MTQFLAIRIAFLLPKVAVTSTFQSPGPSAGQVKFFISVQENNHNLDSDFQKHSMLKRIMMEGVSWDSSPWCGPAARCGREPSDKGHGKS